MGISLTAMHPTLTRAHPPGCPKPFTNNKHPNCMSKLARLLAAICLGLLPCFASAAEVESKTTAATIEVAPPRSAQADRHGQVHLIPPHGNSQSPHLRVHIPERLRPDYDKLEDNATRLPWIASQLETQLAAGDEAAGDDLRSLLLTSLPAAGAPDRAVLTGFAVRLVDRYLASESAENRPQAAAILDAWAAVAPGDSDLNQRRLTLYFLEKNREGILRVAPLVLEDPANTPERRDWAAEVALHALWESRSREDLEKAGRILDAWDRISPGNPNAEFLRLRRDHTMGKREGLAGRCSQLIDEGKIDAKYLPTLRSMRIRLVMESGRLADIDVQDAREILAQRLGGWVRAIDLRLLPWVAILAGFVHLAGIAVVTRCLRKKPPGFLISLIWLPPIAYLSAIVLVAVLPAVVGSLAGIGVLLWSISGSRAPLGYLDHPASPEGARFGKWWGWLVLCLLGLVATWAFDVLYSAVWDTITGQEFESSLSDDAMTASNLPELGKILLVGGVLVPLFEEIVFRGILHDWLVRWLPVVPAILLINAAFGFLHGWELAAPTGLDGMVLSLLRLRFRSLWPCLIIHSANNAIALLALYFGVQ